MGSILGGIFGGGQSSGQQAQMQGLHAAREDIQRYRPEAMQAALNAMSNASTGYQGSNNALETLWGAPQTSGGPQSGRDQLSGGFGSMPDSERQKMNGQGPPSPGAPPSPGGHNYSGGGYQSNDPILSILDPAGLFRGGR